MAALLAPVSVILAILLFGVQHPEASTKGKGNLQIAFTGSITTTSGFPNYQSVFLNVIAVRLNPSGDITISDNDPNWQIIAAPDGTNKTTSVPSLSFGGNFGPNGSAVTVGQGRSEVQIDLAALQNSVGVFNTGAVLAKTYNQVELSLDPTVPGVVVPQCGSASPGTGGPGEGCIPYPLQFPPNSPVSTIRTIAQITPTRGDTLLLTLAINVQLGNSPTTSNQFVSMTPSICALAVNSGTVTSCPNTTTAPPFPLNPNLSINAGVISGTVTGGTNKTIVNAELHGTSTIVSSVKVNKTTHTYTMSLPAPANYDFFTSGRGRSIDAQQNVPVPIGPFTLDFTVKQQASESLSGSVFDACSSSPIQGASLELYKPADQIYLDGSTTPIDCTASSPPAECVTTCDPSPTGQIPAGCMIIGTASTDDIGNYPLPGSGNVTPPFKEIPVFKTGAYALKVTQSGYNGSIQPVTTQSGGALKCPNSGFKNKVCNASLQHGEIDVTASVMSAGGPTPVSPLNILVNAEDSGTFNGEGVGIVSVPAGASTSIAPVPIFVPVSPTASATITPTPSASPSVTAFQSEFDAAKAAPTTTASGTPVVIGGPASFDLFGTTMDLFGSAPQKNSGHTIGVLSGVPAPDLCANSTSNPPAPPATLAGFTCVGHGSAPGVILSTPDATTQIVVSKADPSGNQVDIATTSVVPAGNQNGGSFAICEPADPAGYTIAHVEVQPTGTPSVVGSVSGVMLNTPVVINSPTPSGTPSATPTCQGICSEFSENTGGKSCLLCQGTTTIVNVP
jgi:hypothetical protein